MLVAAAVLGIASAAYLAGALIAPVGRYVVPQRQPLLPQSSEAATSTTNLRSNSSSSGSGGASSSTAAVESAAAGSSYGATTVPTAVITAA
jgi:hypothetical protein